MTSTTKSQLEALLAVPGIKDADITTNRSRKTLIRTTSTGTEEARLLKNAKRQARRRTARLERYFARMEEALNEAEANS